MSKTIAQKIFEDHTRDIPTPGNVVLDIDVVMCHEITTPIAINDLMERVMDRVVDPEKIKEAITVRAFKDEVSSADATSPLNIVFLVPTEGQIPE